MRQINLTQRTARMLAENLEGNSEGYHKVDILKLDWLVGKLTAAQGDYGTSLAELIRTERKLRRQFRKGEITEPALLKALNDLRLDVEDLDEEAESIPVALSVEEADWKLIRDKLDSVDKWSGAGTIRPLVIQMLNAVDKAEVLEIETPKSGKAAKESLTLVAS